MNGVSISESLKSMKAFFAVCILALPVTLLGQGETPVARFSEVVADGREIPFTNAEDLPDTAYRLIAGFRVVWLGEMHGTNEAPAMFLGFVRLVAREDCPPVVALEIPHGDQEAIDEYLKTGDLAVLKTRTFFRADSDAKDGRASRAMANLLRALRTEKVVRVVCIDPSPVKREERDQGMATLIAQCVERYPAQKIVVLTGNVHSRVIQGTPWDKQYQPAAFLLKKIVPSVVTFDFQFEVGSIWARTKEGFGEHKVKGPHWNGSSEHYISLGTEPIQGHQGAVFSRNVTGSPPWP